MMQFLRATKDDCLTLSANSLHNVRWWVDASYAVHPAMKSHSGGAMSLGKGVIYGTSKRQQLNTKSTTEAALVGADDVMPQMLWTLYFLEAQGYKIDDNVLYQDNKSSILLETNGRGSSSKRTRHIKIRNFFISDGWKSKEIRIEYCPTGILIADYFTKPLQGMIFRKLRDMIMGNTDIVLPTNEPDNEPIGIPMVATPRESRSVLGSDIGNDMPPRSLTVLRACDTPTGTPTGPTGTPTGQPARRVSTRITNDDSGAPKTSKLVSGKTVSWAEIASLRTTRAGKCPLFLRNLS
jgi:hypothetical protein